MKWGLSPSPPTRKAPGETGTVPLGEGVRKSPVERPPIQPRISTLRAMTPPPDHLNAADGAYLEDLYRKWKADPASVEPGLHSFFQGFELGFERAAVPRATGTPAVPAARLASGAPEPTPGEWGNLRQWRLD